MRLENPEKSTGVPVKSPKPTIKRRPVKRYQLRLERTEDMEKLIQSLAQSLSRFLPAALNEGASASRNVRYFENALKRVLKRYVFAYDSCEEGCISPEKIKPVAWNLRPEWGKGVSVPAGKMLQIEVRKDLDEFLRGLELVVFNVVSQSWSGPDIIAEDFHIGLRRIIKGTFGPRIFERTDSGCDHCEAGRRLDFGENR
jgi:hypothetical protein